jgi:hypothetical protein
MNAHFEAVMNGEVSPIPIENLDGLTMDEVFQKIIDFNKEIFLKYKTLTSQIVLVVTEPKTKVHKFISLPIIAQDNIEKDIFSVFIRDMISNIIEDKTKNFILSAVVQVMDANLKQYPIEAISKDGKLREQYKTPSQSKDSKDVLLFSMEQEFTSRSITYEYIESSDGEVVLSEKPIFDTKDIFDERRKGRFNNLFTRGSGIN